MSQSVLLDRSQSTNTTITPAHHYHQHNGGLKMNGSAVGMSHRHTSPSILDSSKHSIGANNNSTIMIPSSSPASKVQASFAAVPLQLPRVNYQLASLALMCLCSLLLSLVAFLFLHSIEPRKSVYTRSSSSGQVESEPKSNQELITSDEFFTLYEVSVCLATLAVALDLSCLFVCSLQAIFVAKLLSVDSSCARNFLEQSANNRVLAVSFFLLSIPIFFTALILYAFIHFNTMLAMVTSALIGAAIIFCGLSSIYNVYFWQNEPKIKSILSGHHRSNEKYPPVLDLTSAQMELSTLV